ncbi:MAG: class I SAM-dependent methyltransferase [Alphaproteobacteria bacterium]|nr:class I SAM-dependent methyltransferase [Alphaproteobacteria bacterium]MCB9791876.1 class I SAM-dependent methyltransferase [Alphaproteobacteria bacterium]
MLSRLARLRPQAQLDQLLDPAWRRLAGSLMLTEGASLEIGCGAGWVSIHAAAGHPELDCVGLEWDPTRLAQAQRNGGRRLNCTFREMSPEEICYPEATFDKVIAAGRLQEWRDPGEALRELHRVLKPSGVALLCDPEPDGELPADWLGRTGPWPPTPLIRAALGRLAAGDEAWQALVSEAGRQPWSRVEQDRLGFFRRLVLVK